MEHKRKRSSTSEALDATKQSHKEMKAYMSEPMAVDSATLLSWRTTMAEANREIARLSKVLANENERRKIEIAVITEEMRRELVDREANSARVDERYRVMAERDNGVKSGTYDRAVNSALSIDACIGQLCGHALNVNQGTTLLMQRAKCA